MKTLDVLQTVEWGMEHFGSVVTNRQLLRRDVMREIRRGLVKSIGEVPLCDGDGYLLLPERYREGFVLTDSGKKYLEESKK